DDDLPWAKVNLLNAGSGIAFNVRGVLCGPEPEADSDKVAGRMHGLVYPMPIGSREQSSEEYGFLSKLRITVDVDVGDFSAYNLYAAKRSAFDGGIAPHDARLTLTYCDVFGRKHAAIFDFIPQQTWELVAYLRNIDVDLADIFREAL